VGKYGLLVKFKVSSSGEKMKYKNSRMTIAEDLIDISRELSITDVPLANRITAKAQQLLAKSDKPKSPCQGCQGKCKGCNCTPGSYDVECPKHGIESCRKFTPTPPKPEVKEIKVDNVVGLPADTPIVMRDEEGNVRTGFVASDKPKAVIEKIFLPAISSFATDDEYLWARDITVALNQVQSKLKELMEE
jgi:hypothetical protein